MARVLIGWELGANRGHVVRAARIAARLRDVGHEVAFALQQLDSLGAARDASVTLFQAPLWPRLIASVAVPPRGTVSTLIDILCRLGLDRPGVLAAVMSGWDAILAAWRPDIVIADFAPALLCAARGRMTSVSIGTGFVQPPADLAVMPRLAGPPGFDEEAVLDTIDADLRSIGRMPLPALPALFAADHYLIETFAEIDPYAGHRTAMLSPPSVTPGIFEEAASGDEIFVYAFAARMAASNLWNALAQTGKRVRIYCPDADAVFAAELRRMGLAVETAPVAWRDIARRSRLVVSHGGHGFLCSALLAGVPHLVTYYDLEKQLHAAALGAAGLGAGVALRQVEAAPFAAAILTAYEDAALAARAKAAAPGFAARMHPSSEDLLLALIA